MCNTSEAGEGPFIRYIYVCVFESGTFYLESNGLPNLGI